MFTAEEGRQAVSFARATIDHYVDSLPPPSMKLPPRFEEDCGAFVTLHTYPHHDLRGCIGIPLPIMPLKDAIAEGATSAARDPRFPPLQKSELNTIIIEVTILTKPEEIAVSTPPEYLNKIEIGRDGLIAEQGFFKGLLLPQVPVEQGWDKEEFLSHTCMKAGLPPDAWFDKTTKILKFSGQIFTELQPRGEVKEKKLDGSDS